MVVMLHNHLSSHLVTAAADSWDPRGRGTLAIPGEGVATLEWPARNARLDPGCS